MNAGTEGHKKCPACGLTKPLTDFYIRGGQRSGRQSYCKPCKRDRLRVPQLARQRAASLLIKAHRAEFDAYYAQTKSEVSR